MTHKIWKERDVYDQMGFPQGTDVKIIQLLKSGIAYVQRADGKRLHLPYQHLTELEEIIQPEERIPANQMKMF